MMCIHSYYLWAAKGVIMCSASLYFASLSKFSKMKIPHFYNQEKVKKQTHTLKLFSLHQTEKWASAPAAV